MNSKWPDPSEADSDTQNETVLLLAEPPNSEAPPLYPGSACELLAGLESGHVGPLRKCCLWS